MKPRYFYRWRRVVASVILLAFLPTCGIAPVHAREIFPLPQPGAQVNLSPAFAPPLLKGVKVYPGDPFKLDFILDEGVNPATPTPTTDAHRLIKYFLASVTVPEKDLWVNLSPYEKDRITPDAFGVTEMGRDLLAQDYILKQITASVIYPESDTGKKFWAEVYRQAAARFGTTDIPVDTFNKVWIVPAKAEVYEANNAVYVVASKLKVMLETDYLATSNNTLPARGHVAPPVDQVERGAVSPSTLPTTPSLNDPGGIAKQVLREIIIPILEREVNEGQNFAQLRQVYNSLILGVWYKDKIKSTLLSQAYADRNKVTGTEYTQSIIETPLPTSQPMNAKASQVNPLTTTPNDPELIWQRYVEAFKKGAFSYIKEEVDPATQEVVPRKYFSGGMGFEEVRRSISHAELTRLPRGVLDHAEIVNVKLSAAQPFELHPAELPQAAQRPEYHFATKDEAVASVRAAVAFFRPSLYQEYLKFSASPKTYPKEAKRKLQERFLAIRAPMLSAWVLNSFNQSKFKEYFQSSYVSAMMEAFSSLDLNPFWFHYAFSGPTPQEARDNGIKSVHAAFQRFAPDLWERYEAFLKGGLSAGESYQLKEDFYNVSSIILSKWKVSGAISDRDAPYFGGTLAGVLTACFPELQLDPDAIHLSFMTDTLARRSVDAQIRRHLPGLWHEYQALVLHPQQFDPHRRWALREQFYNISADQFRRRLGLASALKHWGASYGEVLKDCFPEAGLNTLIFQHHVLNADPDYLKDVVRANVERHLPEAYAEYQVFSHDPSGFDSVRRERLKARFYALTNNMMRQWKITEIISSFGSYKKAFIDSFEDLGLTVEGFKKPLVKQYRWEDDDERMRNVNDAIERNIPDIWDQYLRFEASPEDFSPEEADMLRERVYRLQSTDLMDWGIKRALDVVGSHAKILSDVFKKLELNERCFGYKWEGSSAEEIENNTRANTRAALMRYEPGLWRSYQRYQFADPMAQKELIKGVREKFYQMTSTEFLRLSIPFSRFPQGIQKYGQALRWVFPELDLDPLAFDGKADNRDPSYMKDRLRAFMKRHYANIWERFELFRDHRELFDDYDVLELKEMIYAIDWADLAVLGLGGVSVDYRQYLVDVFPTLGLNYYAFHGAYQTQAEGVATVRAAVERFMPEVWQLYHRWEMDPESVSLEDRALVRQQLDAVDTEKLRALGVSSALSKTAEKYFKRTIAGIREVSFPLAYASAAQSTHRPEYHFGTKDEAIDSIRKAVAFFRPSLYKEYLAFAASPGSFTKEEKWKLCERFLAIRHAMMLGWVLNSITAERFRRYFAYSYVKALTDSFPELDLNPLWFYHVFAGKTPEEAQQNGINSVHASFERYAPDLWRRYQAFRDGQLSAGEVYQLKEDFYGLSTATLNQWDLSSVFSVRHAPYFKGTLAGVLTTAFKDLQLEPLVITPSYETPELSRETVYAHIRRHLPNVWREYQALDAHPEEFDLKRRWALREQFYQISTEDFRRWGLQSAIVSTKLSMIEILRDYFPKAGINVLIRGQSPKADLDHRLSVVRAFIERFMPEVYEEYRQLVDDPAGFGPERRERLKGKIYALNQATMRQWGIVDIVGSFGSYKQALKESFPALDLSLEGFLKLKVHKYDWTGTDAEKMANVEDAIRTNIPDIWETYLRFKDHPESFSPEDLDMLRERIYRIRAGDLMAWNLTSALLLYDKHSILLQRLFEKLQLNERCFGFKWGGATPQEAEQNAVLNVRAAVSRNNPGLWRSYQRYVLADEVSRKAVLRDVREQFYHLTGSDLKGLGLYFRDFPPEMKTFGEVIRRSFRDLELDPLAFDGNAESEDQAYVKGRLKAYLARHYPQRWELYELFRDHREMFTDQDVMELRELIYAIDFGDLRAIGLSGLHADYRQSLIDVFPGLGLNYYVFHGDYSTPEKGVKTIRAQVERYMPDVWQIYERWETAPGSVSEQERDFFRQELGTIDRVKIALFGISQALNRRAAAYFNGSIAEILRASFPLAYSGPAQAPGSPSQKTLERPALFKDAARAVIGSNFAENTILNEQEVKDARHLFQMIGVQDSRLEEAVDFLAPIAAGGSYIVVPDRGWVVTPRKGREIYSGAYEDWFPGPDYTEVKNPETGLIEEVSHASLEVLYAAVSVPFVVVPSQSSIYIEDVESGKRLTVPVIFNFKRVAISNDRTRMQFYDDKDMKRTFSIKELSEISSCSVSLTKKWERLGMGGKALFQAFVNHKLIDNEVRFNEEFLLFSREAALFHKYTTDRNRPALEALLSSSGIFDYLLTHGGDVYRHIKFYLKLLRLHRRLGLQIWEGLFEAIKSGGVSPELTVDEMQRIELFIARTGSFDPFFFKIFHEKGAALTDELLAFGEEKILTDAAGPQELKEFTQGLIRKGFSGEEADQILFALNQKVVPGSGASFISRSAARAHARQFYGMDRDTRQDVPLALRSLGRFGGGAVPNISWVLKDGQVYDPLLKVRGLVNSLRYSDEGKSERQQEAQVKQDREHFVRLLNDYLVDLKHEGKRASALAAFLKFASHNDFLKEKVERVVEGEYLGLDLLEQLFLDRDNLRELLNKILADGLFFNSLQSIRDRKVLKKSFLAIWHSSSITLDQKKGVIRARILNIRKDDVEKVMTADFLELPKDLQAYIAEVSARRSSLLKEDVADVLFAEPLRVIREEKEKFNEVTVSESIKLRFQVVKGPGFGIWGMNAGVCIAIDMDLWNKKDFFLLAMIDETSKKAVGFVHLFQKQFGGKKYLTIPGIEPSTEFLSTVKAERLYPLIMEAIDIVTAQGGYEEADLPVNPNILSNRSDILGLAKKAGYRTGYLSEKVIWNTLPAPYPFDYVYVLPSVNLLWAGHLQELPRSADTSVQDVRVQLAVAIGNNRNLSNDEVLKASGLQAFVRYGIDGHWSDGKDVPDIELTDLKVTGRDEDGNYLVAGIFHPPTAEGKIELNVRLKNKHGQELWNQTYDQGNLNVVVDHMTVTAQDFMGPHALHTGLNDIAGMPVADFTSVNHAEAISAATRLNILETHALLKDMARAVQQKIQPDQIDLEFARLESLLNQKVAEGGAWKAPEREAVWTLRDSLVKRMSGTWELFNHVPYGFAGKKGYLFSEAQGWHAVTMGDLSHDFIDKLNKTAQQLLTAPWSKAGFDQADPDKIAALLSSVAQAKSLFSFYRQMLEKVLDPALVDPEADSKDNESLSRPTRIYREFLIPADTVIGHSAKKTPKETSLLSSQMIDEVIGAIHRSIDHSIELWDPVALGPGISLNQPTEEEQDTLDLLFDGSLSLGDLSDLPLMVRMTFMEFQSSRSLYRSVRQALLWLAETVGEDRVIRVWNNPDERRGLIIALATVSAYMDDSKLPSRERWLAWQKEGLLRTSFLQQFFEQYPEGFGRFMQLTDRFQNPRFWRCIFEDQVLMIVNPDRHMMERMHSGYPPAKNVQQLKDLFETGLAPYLPPQAQDSFLDLVSGRSKDPSSAAEVVTRDPRMIANSLPADKSRTGGIDLTRDKMPVQVKSAG
ncbi:MAG: hypothetical protein HQL22_00500, partial [Candidatus Omnitrophica bacterium]|nr:hypothetical protein [Candidatus Omnitrophota bacterium]